MVLATNNGYEISTDQDRLDIDVIHGFLSQAYWCKGVDRSTVEKSIQYSLNFGLYDPSGRQVGFARAVTDRAVFAYIADLFVLPEKRGQGLGKWLMEVLLAHDDLQNLRRLSLATKDARTLYQRFGFSSPDRPEMEMVKLTAPEALYGESENDV